MITIGVIFSLAISFWLMIKRKIVFKNYSFTSSLKLINNISKRKKTEIGVLSITRYLLFSHQFYFLLLLFNSNISYQSALFSIFTMYLLTSVIPMLSLFDIIIKSSVAIWVFSFLNINEIDILCITVLMWLLNFALPSIIGSYFVLTFDASNLFKTNK